MFEAGAPAAQQAVEAAKRAANEAAKVNPQAQALSEAEVEARADAEIGSLTKEAVGSALKLARRARGITQQELAERAELSQSMISDAERGEVLKFENVKAITNALRIKMSALYRVAEQIQEAKPTTRQFVNGIVELMNLTEPDQLDNIIQAGVDSAKQSRRIPRKES